MSFKQYTHAPFNGPFSGTTRVSRYQKGKSNLDFTEARGSEWQWHQLGHMQVCISLQTDNHANTPPLKFFTGRMPFLAPNQQRQSTEGTLTASPSKYRCNNFLYQMLDSGVYVMCQKTMYMSPQWPYLPVSVQIEV